MKYSTKKQKGIALLFALLTLLLLSAVAMGFIYMSNIESQVNQNYQTQEVAYFAARAGIEEARDRMMTGAVPYSLSPLVGTNYVPTQLPSSGSNLGVTYILQNASIDPTAAGSTYDDDLCHEYSFGGMSQGAANVRCTSMPSGKTWFQATTSVAPFNAVTNSLFPKTSTNPMEYKWVRISLKENGSNPNFYVDSTKGAGLQVCYDGTSQRVLSAASCAQMSPAAGPVYLLTALAVTQSGSRRLIQEEVAQTLTVTAPQDFGLFATGTGCPAITMVGNAVTQSFNPGGPGDNPPTDPPGAGNVLNSGGNIGANGGISLSGNANVQGSIGSGEQSVAGVPACYTPDKFPPKGGVSSFYPAVENIPIPPEPKPAPPTSSTTYTSNQSLAPGSYGNIHMSSKSTLTLSVPAGQGTAANPAIFTFNSLDISGQASLAISPATAYVVLDIAANGTGSALTLTGQGVGNTSAVPAQLQINVSCAVAGSCPSVALGGKGNLYAHVNAPGSAIDIGGNGNLYGAVTGNTINSHGNGDLIYDGTGGGAGSVTPSPYFHEIAMRELAY